MGAVLKSQLPASAHHIRIFAATAVNSPRFCYQYVGYSLQVGDDPAGPDADRRRSDAVVSAPRTDESHRCTLLPQCRATN